MRVILINKEQIRKEKTMKNKETPNYKKYIQSHLKKSLGCLRNQRLKRTKSTTLKGVVQEKKYFYLLFIF